MGIEELVDQRFVDVFRLYFAVLGFADQPANGVHDFRAAAVAQRHRQLELVEMSRFLLRGPDPLQRRRREGFRTSDRAEPDALFDQFVPLGGKVMLQESHQGVDFRRRSVPVFLRKCVNRQGLNAEFQAQRDHFADGLDAFPVSGDPGQTARLRPATVSIHNHGEVLRKKIGIEFRGEFCVRQLINAGGVSGIHGVWFGNGPLYEVRMGR